jgi:hypothetical protein
MAAQRQGLKVLSEDTAYVELKPSLKIWSWPGAIHLLPADAPAGEFATRVRGGRTKSSVPRVAGRPFAESAVLVAIVPGTKLDLQPVRRAELFARLQPTEPGFSLLRREIGVALAMLAADAGWRLTLNTSADEAVALLRRRFGGTRP